MSHDVIMHHIIYSTVTHAEARSYSSGLFPACCPLAFIFNCLFFWVPFSGNGFNIHRLEAIRKAISGINVNVIQHGPTCCWVTWQSHDSCYSIVWIVCIIHIVFTCYMIKLHVAQLCYIILHHVTSQFLVSLINFLFPNIITQFTLHWS